MADKQDVAVTLADELERLIYERGRAAIFNGDPADAVAFVMHSQGMNQRNADLARFIGENWPTILDALRQPTTDRPDAGGLGEELSRARVRVSAMNVSDDREGWLKEVLALLKLLEDNWSAILAALKTTEPAPEREARYIGQDTPLVEPSDTEQAQWPPATCDYVQGLERKNARLEALLGEALDDGIATLAAVRATSGSDEWRDSADHFGRTCLETIQRMNAARATLNGGRDDA